MKKEERLEIRLDRATKEALEAKSTSEDKSVAQLVREAIRKFLRLDSLGKEQEK